MANPLETLRKIKGRSWSEIRTRSEQVFSVYAEQVGLSGKLPTDEEFLNLIDKTAFSKTEINAKHLREKFFEHSEYSFFPSLRGEEEIFEIYRERFGGEITKTVLEKADKLIEGKFDLLGYRGLDFGNPVDWHLEPISGKRSPLKHWKQFDELSTDETGDKKILWELNRHQHFFTLGIAYGLTEDEIYAETFAAHLDSWMEANPPGIGVNWFSSLEVAFRSISWIWAFNFFRTSKNLTPELFQKALKFLHLHGRHLEKYLSKYYSPNTHLTGEALGLYYLGTQFPFFKRAAHWRKLGEEILFAELDRQILPDGGYFEQTTWYHRYTTDFYTQFFILKTLNNGKPPKYLKEKLTKKLQSLFNFLMYLTRPDGTIPLIGDDDGGQSLPHGNARSDDFRACLANGAVLFGRSDYKFVAGDFFEETLWLFGIDGLEKFDQIEAKQPEQTSFAFKTSGYFVMRDGWGETDNYLLVDCGELGYQNGGHGHADALAIDLAIGGDSILSDAGTFTYHESEVLRNRFRTTEAHNTLIIDGKSQSEPGGKFSWATKAEAKLKKWICQPRFDFFEGSHNGYQRLKKSPVTHLRSILFLKNDYWIMRDFVKTSGEHEYNLNFHFNSETYPEIENAAGGETCVHKFSANGSGMRLFTFGDNGKWESKKTYISKKYGTQSESKLMQFNSVGKGVQEFFTFFLPDDGEFAKPEVFETDVINGRAFVIKYRDYMDLLVFSDGEQIVRTEIFNTNFRFLWARLSEKDSLPEEFVLIGGKHFSLGGREILNHPKKLDFATARRFGNQLNVRTSETVLSVSLPD